ncbi:glycosyltransferase family 1 protein [Bacteroides faecalis]|uniref:Glycosyl transferase n=1 Tax=Bacteroides faecalis TaxID=2447885 RepID=A0A401LS93_9BACE|nr:glycosyltransferase family 1 protein [Bacteroides faecalis]GCB34425.1 glycosyl transferase [Bacteroides faecalis]
MKAIFLIFHGFEESNGISKKIRYQVKALKECGVDVRICWLDDTDNRKRRMVDDLVIENYGNGIKGKIRKRTNLDCVYRYAMKEGIEVVYVRSDHNTTPFLINLYRKLRKKGIKIALEIPTYPYDQEYKGLSFGYQRVLWIDKCLRHFMAHYINKIVTFSNDSFIFGRPTIQISNGIDFDVVPLKKQLPHPSENELHLIAVATIHPWHGFDRAICGLAEYYQSNVNATPPLRVFLHIVGEGVPEVVSNYHRLTNENNLQEYVIFHGPLFGGALNAVFDQCELGIGSLARHRSGITHLRSLKNREYAARGIPFAYSEIDDDFEGMPYILKIKPDESPLNIAQIIRFQQTVSIPPHEIRQSIEQSLSWKVQMNKVIDSL